MQKVYPTLVTTDSKGMFAVDYIGLISPVVKSIQEQQQQIELLKKENEELKARLEKLEQLMQKIASKNP